jgi:hypothetical protein
VDDINDAAPNDVSYVYSGYAPISIRLVQCITQKNAILSTGPGNNAQGQGQGQGQEQQLGQVEDSSRPRKTLAKAHAITGWRGFEDVVGSIPGATVDVRQRPEGSAGAERRE